MKKRFIAIASLMLCLAAGSVVSYAEAPSQEMKQATVDEDTSYMQQDQTIVNEGIQEQENQNADKTIVTGNVIIEDIDEAKGTFSVILSDVQNEDKLSRVLMAVWCDTNGQDDLQ